MLYDEKKIKRSIKDTIIMAACAHHQEVGTPLLQGFSDTLI